VNDPRDDLAQLRQAYEQQHLCGRCMKADVCHVARAVDPELLQTISACGAFREDLVTTEPSRASRVFQVVGYDGVNGRGRGFLGPNGQPSAGIGILGALDVEGREGAYYEITVRELAPDELATE
jgi:hypothetical protein